MTRRPACVLIVTGSIAAYKAPLVLRALLLAGLDVYPVLTRSAERFVGAATLAGLAGRPALLDMFEQGSSGEPHVELAALADVVLVVPATADFLARMAQGRADDLATATVLCTRAPVVCAPAMHPRMWDHPATKRNVKLLDETVTFVGPVEGPVASGDTGVGRMAEPDEIVRAVLAKLQAHDLVAHDLAGRHIVVSAGPTVEDLDPVRFISNRSTGKMGYAIAQQAARRGAKVTLVSGPVQELTPAGVLRVDVRGALQMKSALWQALGADLAGADALIMTAAVADYRPETVSDAKLKREGAPPPIQLVANPDLIAEIGAARGTDGPVLVAFAVETMDDAGLVASARKKLVGKRVDLVVANHAAESFGRDDNRAAFVTADAAEFVGPIPKTELADRLLDRLLSLLP